MSIEIDFSGQTVLVTEGATGLGLAIARAFGQAGARIVLNDLTSERVEEACASLATKGIDCRGFAADMRDVAAVSDRSAHGVEAFGVPDIAVANAGVYPNTPFLELSEEEWDRVLDTNLKGVFLTCQTVAKALVAASRTGQLVVIASGAANTTVWGWSHYCASKAAVAVITRAMALELGDHGLRVNAVLPGYIDVLEGGPGLDDAYKETARADALTGRPGEPEDSPARSCCSAHRWQATSMALRSSSTVAAPLASSAPDHEPQQRRLVVPRGRTVAREISSMRRVREDSPCSARLKTHADCGRYRSRSFAP